MDWLTYDFLSDLPSDLASGVRLGFACAVALGAVVFAYRLVCVTLRVDRDGSGGGPAENS